MVSVELETDVAGVPALVYTPGHVRAVFGYDERLGNRNWDAVRRKYGPMAERWSKHRFDLPKLLEDVYREFKDHHPRISWSLGPSIGNGPAPPGTSWAAQLPSPSTLSFRVSPGL